MRRRCPSKHLPKGRTKPPLLLLGKAEFGEVERGYRGMMECVRKTDPVLCDVMRYILRHPGGLVRAQLAYGILRAHGVKKRQAVSLAVGLEYFHTASLIFDDMPQMDNATERRGSPCVHIKFGEAMATLGALALINRGYTLIWDVIGTLPVSDRLEASQLLTECLGLHGILNGQALDLNFSQSGRKERDVVNVAMGKTVTLIRLTLLLPAIVSGIPRKMRVQLGRLATLWGLSYQIIDDFKDCLLTVSEAGKSVRRDSTLLRPSLPSSVGRSRALHRVESLLSEARALVRSLTAEHHAWQPLVKLQALLDREAERIHARLAHASAA